MYPLPLEEVTFSQFFLESVRFSDRFKRSSGGMSSRRVEIHIVATGQFGIAAEITLEKYGEIAELPRWA